MFFLDNVSKSYGKTGVRAVDGVSLQVENGEIFGFLGPNGAGKTTTIKMITGILEPDTGTISLDALSLKTQALAAKRQFTFVPDTPEMFSRLKAMDYLDFVANIYGVSPQDRQERIQHYAGLFQISSVLNARIASFSHGMKQKLFLVASLIPDPQNWILDEPLVGLDPEAAFNLKELMRQRARQRKTVFFSTHIMEVAEKLCDRIGIIKAGRLIFQGTLEELKTQDPSRSLEELFLALVDAKTAASTDRTMP